MILAIATKCSVYLYDTQQKIPFALISNIHYTRLTDLTWANDGKVLLVSSTDGYCTIVQFADGELGKVYEKQTLEEIVSSRMEKDVETKNNKRKKVRRPKIVGDLNKSTAMEEKENENESENENDDRMDVDDEDDEITETITTLADLNNLPESIIETFPVGKIIKSNDMFSPEKQHNLPVTPIQVRKCPRVPDELLKASNIEPADIKITPAKNSTNAEAETSSTPKASVLSKTPNRIEIRRFPRTTQQINATASKEKNDDNTWPKPIFFTDSIERKVQQSAVEITQNHIASPKTPRRVEFQTITTPKSKKKLL